jgi:pyruvate/2-oxoglutarate dehydrogenase complex dihydrolipoamide dehydrogenase (E3) component
VHQPGQDLDLVGSHLLVATGRVPATDRLNLSAAGVAVDARGYVVVNGGLETNVPGVYAMGDIKGGPAFTSVAYDDYRVLRTNLLGKGGATIENRLVPYTVYTDPQLGCVGLTETEARAQGKQIKVAKMLMKRVARAVEMDETRGVMKVIIDAETDRILGAAILGMEGGELMSVLQMAIMGGLPYTTLENAIYSHPTLAESLNNLFSGL